MYKLIAAGALALFLAVGFGAFGAHALRERLDEYARGVYEKAVFYHFVHAFGLIIVGILSFLKIIDDQASYRLGALLILGLILFSGSLYLLAVTGQRWFGTITPFGGSMFLIAWAYLAWKLIRS